MFLEKVHYHCGVCEHTFDVLMLTTPLYGEFVMHSEGSGEMAYFNALDNAVYNEVDMLLSTTGIVRVSDKTTALKEIFGVACDSASDGTLYQLYYRPHCSNCGADNLYWEGSTPPLLIDINLPSVTHHKWESMEVWQKEQTIRQEVKRKGL